MNNCPEIVVKRYKKEYTVDIIVPKPILMNIGNRGWQEYYSGDRRLDEDMLSVCIYMAKHDNNRFLESTYKRALYLLKIYKALKKRIEK